MTGIRVAVSNWRERKSSSRRPRFALLIFHAWAVHTGCGDVKSALDAPPEVPIDAAVDTVDAPVDDPALIPVGTLFAFEALCPTGFTERVDLANVYLRGHNGDTTYGERGGSASHTHQIAAHTHTIQPAGNSHTHQVSFATAPQSAGAVASGTLDASRAQHGHGTASTSSAGGPHMHAIAMADAITTTSAPTEPAFREVVLCEVTGAVTVLPTTALMLSDSACPAGWSSPANLAVQLLRVHDLDGDLSEVGGGAAHAHAFDHAHGSATSEGGDHMHTVTASIASGTEPNASSGAQLVADSVHRHGFSITSTHSHSLTPFSGSTSSSVVRPEFREIFGCLVMSGPAPLPPSALVLTLGPCPTGWSEVVAYRNRFLAGDDGDATTGEIGGGPDTHTASHTLGTTGTTDHRGTPTITSPPTTIGVLQGTDVALSAADHTHVLTISVAESHAHATNSASPSVSMDPSLPPYIEVTVCRRM